MRDEIVVDSAQCVRSSPEVTIGVIAKAPSTGWNGSATVDYSELWHHAIGGTACGEIASYGYARWWPR